jgi:hypothetical protein
MIFRLIYICSSYLGSTAGISLPLSCRFLLYRSSWPSLQSFEERCPRDHIPTTSQEFLLFLPARCTSTPLGTVSIGSKIRIGDL